MNSDKTNITGLARILEHATYTNGYSPFVPWSNSIGFKVQSLRFQEKHSSSSIAEDFLANIGFTRNDIESECSMQTYLESVGSVMLSFSCTEDNNHLRKIALPQSVPLKMSLDSVLKSRRSIRQYTGDSISFEYLATVARAALGITSTSEVNLNDGSSTSINLRTQPSAGGIYPTELYIACLNVKKLDRGIYQYNPVEDCLVQLFDEKDTLKLLECFSVQEDQISLSRASAICLLAGSAAKSMYKYGNRGLGFTLHEIGSISQNIHLAITALGLAGVDCASYYNAEIHNLMKFDGIYKHLFHAIVIGVGR
ncbi:SagB/ThcOx family dehydrogenase [Legionella dresdenensis]|uniref:SagB/ThcOx family dehydrogenase n=1 Tax=Legionella dresdenensis TaxID=450200 RepID=A0ABV8CFE6_9GAMM